MAKIYIPSAELIQTLKISSQELISIQNFFDSIPDDEWELTEGKDYRIVHSNGLREYTESGAYTIARYLEATRKKGFWSMIQEWIFHTRENLRKSFVRRKILENSSSLVKRNNQFWISRADAVAIFGTKPSYLTKMADYARQSSDPLVTLIKGQDFEEFVDEGGLYFSLEGIRKLSCVFHESLTKRNRKEECKDVGEVIQPQIKDIVDQIEQREKQIRNAKIKAKKRDNKTCQVTQKTGDPITPLDLAAHHLYSCNEYPLLAACVDNLITISCEVHDRFHLHYMGGTHKACTVDDFINFVQQYYPANTEIIIRLEHQKNVLGKQTPVGKGKPPHVLYLPYSKVS